MNDDILGQSHATLGDVFKMTSGNTPTPNPNQTQSAEGEGGGRKESKEGGSETQLPESRFENLEESETFQAANQEFLASFTTPNTGFSNGGPILNDNANVLPTISDVYRDTGVFSDFKLNDGLARARPYRKPDSQPGQSDDGLHGNAFPTKMFGRDSRTYDLNYKRDEMLERAKSTLKKMGTKNGEVPEFAHYFPWQWNNLDIHGEGSTPAMQGLHLNQYNRNYNNPDADDISRRLYEPTPSRRTKLITTDVETAALMPQRTMLHPMKVITEDRERMQLQRIPKNTDVIESVVYENIMPRGMGSKIPASRVHADPTELRQPIGTNETGDRSVLGAWNNPFSQINPLQHQHNEDRLVQHISDFKYVQGKDVDAELERELMEQQRLIYQSWPDPLDLTPTTSEYKLKLDTPGAPVPMQNKAW